MVLLSPSGSPHPYYVEHGWVAETGKDTTVPGPDTVWKAESKGPLSDWCYVDVEAGDDGFTSSVSGWRSYEQEIMMVNVITGEVRRLAARVYRSAVLKVLRQGTVARVKLHPVLNNWLDRLEMHPVPLAGTTGIGRSFCNCSSIIK